jgi:hypothetical protein
MKLITYLLNLLIGSTGKSVRIDPDHLPGLRAPKPAPFRPSRPESEPGPEVDYGTMYRNYKASKKKPTKPIDRGVGF